VTPESDPNVDTPTPETDPNVDAETGGEVE
jgi:hypothetical protein